MPEYIQDFNTYPQQWRGPEDKRRHVGNTVAVDRDYEPVDLNKVTLKGRLPWIVSGIITVASVLIYGTILVMQFWHQAEVFRSDVLRQFADMNANIEKVATEIKSIANDKAVVRLPDLGMFCIMLQRENPDLKCPAALSELGFSSRITRSQQEQGWQARQTQR